MRQELYPTNEGDPREGKELRASPEAASLIAAYEELLQVPGGERIVRGFGDHGGRSFREGATDAQIAGACEKALALLGLDRDTFQREGLSCSREELLDRMRDQLLAGALTAGDQVLFVATEPYGGPGDFCLRGGRVLAIDPGRMTCSVRGDFFTMDDVPLHYVLGRYDRSAPGTHYGFSCVEPLFGEHPELAARYLQEVEAQYNALRFGEQEAAPSMEL